MTPDSHVYLDHAAATPMRPEVAAAIAAAQAEGFANPSSQHAAGRAARRLLEDARDRIVHRLGGRRAGHRLVFTSGSSEANHLAIVGMASAAGRNGTVFFSRRDHPSAVAAVQSVVGGGWRGEELALDTDGRIERRAAAAALAAAAGAAASILSVTHVCGQTGSIDGGPEAPPGVFVHVDATQSAGLLPLDAGALPVATLALAPHKFGGPRGIGGLLVRADVAIDPVLGGTQEQGLRGGTEAVALAVGFAKALEVASADREADVRRLALLRDRFEGLVLAAAGEAGVSATVLAAGGPRSPHISTIAFAGVDRQALAMAADLAGVCLATGTACASGASEPAPALVAMGLDDSLVRGAVRFSFGRTTSREDVEAAAARLGPLLRRCR